MNKLKLIKKIIPITLVTLMLTISSFAQKDNSLPDITFSANINLSADVVWEKLRQLDGLENIAPDIFASSSKNTQNPKTGTIRTCIGHDKSKWVETIIEFNDQSRFFKYRLDQGPVPAKNMVNTVRVLDLGYNKSVFVWTSSFDFIENPNVTEEQFKGLMSSSITLISEGLK